MSIVASITVPRYANFVAQQRAAGAARKISADLAYAKRQARFSSASQIVTFNVAADTYTLAGVDDPDHPGEPYQVDLADEPYGATIISATFDTDTEVIFDGYGVPDSGGSVVIQVGDYRKRITVDGDTSIPIWADE